MFINPAYAQAASDASTANPVIGVVFQFVLIFAVFYFLLIRPQSQKAKKHNIMLESLKKGDKIVTSGGVLGVVSKINNQDEISVEVADGVKVKVLRSTIRDALDENGNSVLEKTPTNKPANVPNKSDKKEAENKKEEFQDKKQKEEKSSNKNKKSDELKKALLD